MLSSLISFAVAASSLGYGFVSAQASNAPTAEYLPYPLSQGGERWETFVRNCRVFASGNTNGVATPSTYFTKMPDEWLASNNNTIASTARKFDSNFSNLGASVRTFYVELCPMIGPLNGMYISILPYPASQGGLLFELLVRNCYAWASFGASANLAAPSSYFREMPPEWFVVGTPTVNATARKYQNTLSTLNAEGIRGFYGDFCPLLALSSGNPPPPPTSSSTAIAPTSTSSPVAPTGTTRASTTATRSPTSSPTRIVSAANSNFSPFGLSSSIGVVILSAITAMVL